ncbi:MAG: acyl-CoA reductase [Arcobacter sp.]|nr:MAG: acyl-CoA reductase [Arcobacter sp.]
MIPISLKKHDNVQYLIGEQVLELKPFVPYDDLLCDLLCDFSKSLLKNKQAQEYPDVIAFAFWCRKSNISKLKESFGTNHNRLGLGIVFHITPSNVAVNFAFSFVFGLLSGNANIVRVPSKNFAQIDIICYELKRILEIKKYKLIKKMTTFIKYDRDNDITSYFSSICNARIIWGGDLTINNIRSLPVSARCVDVAFSDRFSFSVINAESLIELDNVGLDRLIEGFYNDTYLMDQNACSSPHLLVWTGKNKSKAKNIFWNALYLKVKNKYELSSVNAVDKFTLLCKNSIDLDVRINFKNFDNFIYVLNLNQLVKDIDKHHGKFGYFFEYDTDNFDELSSIVTNKYQTLTYFGINKNELVNFVVNNSLVGIDRIVPIGKALDMDVIWDGYDIVSKLSRIIDFK